MYRKQLLLSLALALNLSSVFGLNVQQPLGAESGKFQNSDDINTRYDHHKVIRIDHRNAAPQDRQILLNSGYDVWARSKDHIDVQVNSTQLKDLKALGFSWETIVDNVATAISETFDADPDHAFNAASDQVQANESFFLQYQSLDSINSWLSYIAGAYPDVITLEEIGRTYENRPLQVVHFATPSNDDKGHKSRKTVAISGGIHSREWVSISLVLYLINSLLELHIANPDSSILALLDFLFFPVLNPDGYQYTWTDDRLWRKNRQNTTHSSCLGIDIDHSFDYHWLESTGNQCSAEYAGEEPLEAIEARAMDRFLQKTNENHTIYGFIELHSYSEEVLYPYSYLCDLQPRDEENLIELAYGIAKTMRLSLGQPYTVSPACVDRDSDLIPSLGAGSSLDYMYHNKAYWAFQFKLRDTGTHGFLLPPKYIVPVGKESFEGLTYFCQFILAEY